MSTETTVPITVEPAAAAWVEQMGMRPWLDRILEYLQSNIPGLRAITVELDTNANMWDEASIIINTHQPIPDGDRDPTTAPLIDWYIKNIPTDVGRHFVCLPMYEGPNGR